MQKYVRVPTKLILIRRRVILYRINVSSSKKNKKEFSKNM
ncbi:hypothetical protein LEP1GSC072_0087 [Leptospira noguchii str. Bonito]|nr:hypothetical protein LEP1GSC072_0087 [Leptospira noguchii str. Bonito]